MIEIFSNDTLVRKSIDTLVHANYTDSQLVTHPLKQNGQLVTRPWKHNGQLVTEKSVWRVDWLPWQFVKILNFYRRATRLMFSDNTWPNNCGDTRDTETEVILLKCSCNKHLECTTVLSTAVWHCQYFQAPLRLVSKKRDIYKLRLLSPYRLTPVKLRN